MSKPQTRASYEARLNRVVDHIYAHLDEDIRFDDLAEVACRSSRITGTVSTQRFEVKR